MTIECEAKHCNASRFYKRESPFSEYRLYARCETCFEFEITRVSNLINEIQEISEEEYIILKVLKE